MVGDWGGHLYLNSRVRHYYHRRCKRERPTDIDCLPDDLLSSILVFLPADYLHHTARLVCHRWFYIICSDAFVNKQIQHSKYGLLSSQTMVRDQYPIFASATQGGRVETREICCRLRSIVKTSYNGLVITEDSSKYDHRGSTIYITNLATKQSFNTPPVHFFRFFDIVAIAFAAHSNKYKVVVPYWTGEHDTCLAILTFGVDKAWRNVGVHHLPKSDRLAMFEEPLVTEGFMHWTKHGTTILTLDVENETLMMFSLPLFLRHGALFYLSTGRFLSLLVGHKDLSWELWGMESGTGEWKKMLPDFNLGDQVGKLQQLSSTERCGFMPIGWVNYPEVLAFYFCYDPWTCTCIFYNLYTHEIDSTELPYPMKTLKAFVHKDTVLRLS